jgi:PLP dependent protein
MNLPEETFQDRLAAIRERIRLACERAGRRPEDVTLVAVTKTFGPDEVREAADAGLSVFGESRIQEAAQKIPLCPGRLEWHMIGHLQRNKVKHVPALFRMVHSVDSARLLEALDETCEEAGCRMPALLEINVSGEGSKFGLSPEAVPAVLESSRALRRVDVRGFMTIPPFNPDPEAVRPFFRRLRTLRDQWRAGSGLELPELSMGMSGDFEVAIEEGATLIRVGSILFGARPARAASRPPEVE